MAVIISIEEYRQKKKTEDEERERAFLDAIVREAIKEIEEAK